jgi:hypothetical protein
MLIGELCQTFLNFDATSCTPGLSWDFMVLTKNPEIKQGTKVPIS